MIKKLKSLWRGEIPLCRAYWIYGAIVPIAILITGAIILFMLRRAPSRTFFIAVCLFYFFLISVYGLIADIGILRSAKAYQGSTVWQFLAMVSVFLSLIMMIYNIFTLNSRIALLLFVWGIV